MMKKTLKIIGIILVVLVGIVGLAAAYIQISDIPSYEVHPPELKVQGDSAMVAEGKRLSGMVCSACHMAGNGKLEGKYLQEIPAMFGKVWSANITQDTQYGAVSRYTDGELVYLLRTGVKRDGRYAPPWMPKFPHLSDQDMHSIIAYLRSDAPELQPSDAVHPAQQPSFFAKFLCRVAFKPLPYPSAPIIAPLITDKVAYGRYLAVDKVGCYDCHSASFETNDIMEPEKSVGFFGGGNGMPDMDNNIVYTRNLTPDKETGIGNWTEEQFIKAVKYGQRPNGQLVRYPMLPHGTLTDEEVSTIWAYLQTIPAIKNDVDKLYEKPSN